MRGHDFSRTTVLLIIALFAIGVAGCASSTKGYQGSPPFDYNSEDLRASLEEFTKLADALETQIGVWGVNDVERHIITSSKVAREKGSYPDLMPERHTTATAKNKVVTKVWRFASISNKTLSLPIVSWRDVSNIGFSLSATEHNGKLVEVKTSFVPMPEHGVSYATKDAILMGAGAAAVLFLLP